MTTEETSIPCALGVWTPAWTASVTAATSPVSTTKDLPPMPVPRRTSTSPTSAAFTAASGVCLNADGFVGADAVTRQTGEADVFAGGAATGAHDVARAIAEGREAAISIHRFVHSNQSFVIGRDKRDYKPLARSSVGVAIDELESAPRQAAENGLLSDAQLHCEAGRCLGCGTVVLNEDQCIGCGICTTKCKFDAIHLEKVNDTHGRGYFRTLLTVASNAPAAGRRFVRKKLQH